MMLNSIPRLNETGYRIVEELAEEASGLFLEGDIEEIRSRIEVEANKAGDSPYYAKNIDLDVPLEPLNQIEQAGPDTDAHYAPLVRQAISGITVAEAADPLLWASINCFALSPYTTVRWSTSKLKKSNPANFIKNHWLWSTKPRISNASARLWWLFETAHRAAKFSKYSSERLLEYMADNVELYHQLTDRAYSAANPILVAAIYDLAIDKYDYLFDKPRPNVDEGIHSLLAKFFAIY